MTDTHTFCILERIYDNLTWVDQRNRMRVGSTKTVSIRTDTHISNILMKYDYSGCLVRVEITPEQVSVLWFTMEKCKQEDIYPSIEDSPQWIQERIALLSIAESNVVVDGIGYHSLDNIYWLEEE